MGHNNTIVDLLNINSKRAEAKKILYNFKMSLKEAVEANDVKGMLTYKANIINQEKEVIAIDTQVPTNGPNSVMQPLLERGVPTIFGFTPYIKPTVNGKFV